MFWHPKKMLGHLKAPNTPWVGLYCKREDRIFNLIEYGRSTRQCVTNITAGSGQLCSPACASDSHRLFHTTAAGVSVWAGGTWRTLPQGPSPERVSSKMKTPKKKCEEAK